MSSDKLAALIRKVQVHPVFVPDESNYDDMRRAGFDEGQAALIKQVRELLDISWLCGESRHLECPTCMDGCHFTAPPADTTALRALEDLHWIVDEITEKLNDHELAGRILDNVVKLEAAIQDAPQRCDVAQEACVQMDSGINWDVCDTHVRVDDNGQLVAAEFQQPAEDEA